MYFSEHQSNEVDRKEMRKKYRDKYLNFVTEILQTSLNSRNTNQANITFAVPSILYGFQALNWSITKLEDIDRQARNVLRNHHMLHENSDVDRIYVPRPDGGKDLLNITDLIKVKS